MASKYYLTLTTYGSDLIAQAHETGPINLKNLVIGDASGIPYDPLTAINRTQLVNQKARIPIQHLEVINDVVRIQATIGADIGGFNIHEIGLTDESDQLVYIGNYHGGYKSIFEDGAGGELTISINIKGVAANNINLSVDPNINTATQVWIVDNYIPRNEIVDNLTSNEANKPISARQAKILQESKVQLDNSPTSQGPYVSWNKSEGQGETDFINHRGLGSGGFNFYNGDNNNFNLIAYIDGSGVFTPLNGVNGNASTATKLKNARDISFSGAATGSYNFDGSANASCILTLANSGVVASTYGSTLKIPVLTVNAKGLITGVSEQNIPIVDDLSTDDGNKPLSARQGKKLQDEKFSKSGGQLSGKLTTKPSYLAQNLDDIGAGDNSPIRVPGKLIPLNMTGYIPFVHGSVVTDGSGYQTHVSMGAYRGSNTWDNSGVYIAVGGKDVAPTEAFMFLNGRKISNTTGPIDLVGNASSANKLAIPRTVFGHNFDGSNDVGGTVIASTGLVQSDEYHYIDMGRNGLDRMSFYNYGAVFNFIDSQNGNVVARITQNGIDCNAASATRLKTPRNIALSGAVSGNANFDGSGNIDITAVLNNFSGLKESNGYKYLGDGTLIQWVRLNKIVGQYSGEYNFPIAFPNVCFGVSISNSWYVSQAGNGYQLRAGVKSNTVFGIGEDNFNGQGVGNMSQAFVIAIGC